MQVHNTTKDMFSPNYHEERIIDEDIVVLFNLKYHIKLQNCLKK